MNRLNIALSGRSGSGKTTVSDYLVSQHGYALCSTGRACREVAEILFESQSKSLMNEITEAMKAIDPQVWLRAALREAPSHRPLVFDSMRFLEDHEYLTERGFVHLRIQAPLEICEHRMRERGQALGFGYHTDRTETEILAVRPDHTIENGGEGVGHLHRAVDELLRELMQ